MTLRERCKIQNYTHHSSALRVGFCSATNKLQGVIKDGGKAKQRADVVVVVVVIVVVHVGVVITLLSSSISGPSSWKPSSFA